MMQLPKVILVYVYLMECNNKKILEHINRNRPGFERFSNDLMRMKGRQAWRNI